MHGHINIKAHMSYHLRLNISHMTGSVRLVYYWGAFVQPLLQWESINIIHSECVSVALGIQHAYGHFNLSGPTIFFHVFSQTERFTKKKSYWKPNVCFDFLYNFCPKHFSF